MRFLTRTVVAGSSWTGQKVSGPAGGIAGSIAGNCGG